MSEATVVDAALAVPRDRGGGRARQGASVQGMMVASHAAQGASLAHARESGAWGEELAAGMTGAPAPTL